MNITNNVPGHMKPRPQEASFSARAAEIGFRVGMFVVIMVCIYLLATGWGDVYLSY